MDLLPVSHTADFKNPFYLYTFKFLFCINIHWNFEMTAVWTNIFCRFYCTSKDIRLLPCHYSPCWQKLERTQKQDSDKLYALSQVSGFPCDTPMFQAEDNKRPIRMIAPTMVTHNSKANGRKMWPNVLLSIPGSFIYTITLWMDNEILWYDSILLHYTALQSNYIIWCIINRLYCIHLHIMMHYVMCKPYIVLCNIVLFLYVIYCFIILWYVICIIHYIIMLYCALFCIYCHVMLYCLIYILTRQHIARQLLDEHSEIRARNNRTNVIARC
jgi:hypothetical protein